MSVFATPLLKSYNLASGGKKGSTNALNRRTESSDGMNISMSSGSLI